MAAGRLSRDELEIRPVTLDEWPDLQALFSEAGVQHGCWCMYWRIKRAQFDAQYGEENRKALHEIIASGTVPGILAYLDGRPVAWCSVAPRTDFGVLDRSRTLRRVDDEAVWSIVCFFISKQHRGKGLTRLLIDAATEYARGRGARIIEAYPVIPENSKNPQYQVYTGVISTFTRMGFVEVARRSKIRPIMRYTIDD